MKKIILFLALLIMFLSGCTSEVIQVEYTYVEEGQEAGINTYEIVMPVDHVTVVCGVDLEVGTYTWESWEVNEVDGTWFIPLYTDYKSVDTTTTVPDNYLKQGNEFYCEEGYEIEFFLDTDYPYYGKYNYGGTLTFSQVQEENQPPVEITEYMHYDVKEEKKICYKSYNYDYATDVESSDKPEETSCSNLKYEEQLIEELDSKK